MLKRILGAMDLIHSSFIVFQDIFSGGGPTVSTAVEWAMSEMMKNPRVMEKAQAEVRRVFDGKGDVDETGIDELKFLKAVVSETLRLHPPFPLLLPRECREKCKLMDMRYLWRPEWPLMHGQLGGILIIGLKLRDFTQRDSLIVQLITRVLTLDSSHSVLEGGCAQAYCLPYLALSCH